MHLAPSTQKHSGHAKNQNLKLPKNVQHKKFKLTFSCPKIVL